MWTTKSDLKCNGAFLNCAMIMTQSAAERIVVQGAASLLEGSVMGQ
jgi:hypothetical protein